MSGSHGEPPPHLRPAIAMASPSCACTTRVLVTAGKRSAPVAGHEVWVLRSTSAAGRPSVRSARCFSLVRKPEMIWTAKGALSATIVKRRASSTEIPHRSEKSQTASGEVRLLSGILSGITADYMPGGTANRDPNHTRIPREISTVPPA